MPNGFVPVYFLLSPLYFLAEGARHNLVYKLKNGISGSILWFFDSCRSVWIRGQKVFPLPQNDATSVTEEEA